MKRQTRGQKVAAGIFAATGVPLPPYKLQPLDPAVPPRQVPPVAPATLPAKMRRPATNQVVPLRQRARGTTPPSPALDNSPEVHVSPALKYIMLAFIAKHPQAQAMGFPEKMDPKDPKLTLTRQQALAALELMKDDPSNPLHDDANHTFYQWHKSMIESGRVDGGMSRMDGSGGIGQPMQDNRPMNQLAIDRIVNQYIGQMRLQKLTPAAIRAIGRRMMESAERLARQGK